MFIKRFTSLFILIFLGVNLIGQDFLVYALVPSDIINGVFFFDGQDTDNNGLSIDEPLNNDPITNLVDKFNTHTGSQNNTVKKPIYKTNSINSYPSLFFDGINDVLNIDDSLDISTGTGYTEKSYAMIIKTSSDISTLQTIYDEGTKEKGFSFQIEASRLYASAYNSIDWLSPNQYKTIDLGLINTNTIYTIIFVYDQNNDFVKAYLNGNIQGTLNNISPQTTHGACTFETSFNCNVYLTGGTIALGTTKNDTLRLSNNTQIVGLELNPFSGYIGEISSWNHALTNTEVLGINDYLFVKWGFDIIAPTITASSPFSGSLLPGGSHTISFEYNDTHTGSTGIDTTSSSMILEKWDSLGLVWNNVTLSGLLPETITATGANYPTNNLDFGKYRYNFSISDNSANTSSTGAVFYIDQPEFIVSTGSLDMGIINDTSNTFSPEVTITVKTVGAGFNVILNKNTNLTYLGENINDWDGTVGFGYDTDIYTGNISLIGIDQNIGTQVASINTNGNLNTYTYKVKLGAIINALNQAGGDYNGSIDFGIIYTY